MPVNLIAYDPVLDRTKTELVTVREDAPEMTVVMPGGEKNSILDNTNSGAFAARVGGLDDIAEQENPGPGERIIIRLTVTADERKGTLGAADEAEYEEGKAAISALPTLAGQTVVFLDLSLERTAIGGAAPGVTDIGDSNTQLLHIILPFDTGGKTNIRVFRYHKYAGVGVAEQLTPAPDEGYELSSISAVDQDGKPLTLTKQADGSYSFKMPDSAVTVSSAFLKSLVSPTVSGVADWLITDEHIVYINGYPDGSVKPGNNITRAEVATIVNHMLGRAADADYVAANADRLKQFTDLQDAGKWYYLDMVEATNAHEFTRADGTERWTA